MDDRSEFECFQDPTMLSQRDLERSISVGMIGGEDGEPQRPSRQQQQQRQWQEQQRQRQRGPTADRTHLSQIDPPFAHRNGSKPAGRPNLIGYIPRLPSTERPEFEKIAAAATWDSEEDIPFDMQPRRKPNPRRCSSPGVDQPINHTFNPGNVRAEVHSSNADNVDMSKKRNATTLTDQQLHAPETRAVDQPAVVVHEARATGSLRGETARCLSQETDEGGSEHYFEENRSRQEQKLQQPHQNPHQQQQQPCRPSIDEDVESPIDCSGSSARKGGGGGKVAGVHDERQVQKPAHDHTEHDAARDDTMHRSISPEIFSFDFVLSGSPTFTKQSTAKHASSFTSAERDAVEASPSFPDRPQAFNSVQRTFTSPTSEQGITSRSNVDVLVTCIDGLFITNSIIDERDEGGDYDDDGDHDHDDDHDHDHHDDHHDDDDDDETNSLCEQADHSEGRSDDSNIEDCHSIDDDNEHEHEGDGNDAASIVESKPDKDDRSSSSKPNDRRSNRLVAVDAAMDGASTLRMAADALTVLPTSPCCFLALESAIMDDPISMEQVMADEGQEEEDDEDEDLQPTRTETFDTLTGKSITIVHDDTQTHAPFSAAPAHEDAHPPANRDGPRHDEKMQPAVLSRPQPETDPDDGFVPPLARNDATEQLSTTSNSSVPFDATPVSVARKHVAHERDNGKATSAMDETELVIPSKSNDAGIVAASPRTHTSSSALSIVTSNRPQIPLAGNESQQPCQWQDQPERTNAGGTDAPNAQSPSKTHCLFFTRKLEAPAPSPQHSSSPNALFFQQTTHVLGNSQRRRQREADKAAEMEKLQDQERRERSEGKRPSSPRRASVLMSSSKPPISANNRKRTAAHASPSAGILPGDIVHQAPTHTPTLMPTPTSTRKQAHKPLPTSPISEWTASAWTATPVSASTVPSTISPALSSPATASQQQHQQQRHQSSSQIADMHGNIARTDSRDSFATVQSTTSSNCTTPRANGNLRNNRKSPTGPTTPPASVATGRGATSSTSARSPASLKTRLTVATGSGAINRATGVPKATAKTSPASAKSPSSRPLSTSSSTSSQSYARSRRGEKYMDDDEFMEEKDSRRRPTPLASTRRKRRMIATNYFSSLTEAETIAVTGKTPRSRVLLRRPESSPSARNSSRKPSKLLSPSVHAPVILPVTRSTNHRGLASSTCGDSRHVAAEADPDHSERTDSGKQPQHQPQQEQRRHQLKQVDFETSVKAILDNTETKHESVIGAGALSDESSSSEPTQSPTVDSGSNTNTKSATASVAASAETKMRMNGSGLSSATKAKNVEATAPHSKQSFKPKPKLTSCRDMIKLFVMEEESAMMNSPHNPTDMSSPMAAPSTLSESQAYAASKVLPTQRGLEEHHVQKAAAFAGGMPAMPPSHQMEELQPALSESSMDEIDRPMVISKPPTPSVHGGMGMPRLHSARNVNAGQDGHASHPPFHLYHSSDEVALSLSTTKSSLDGCEHRDDGDNNRRPPSQMNTAAYTNTNTALNGDWDNAISFDDGCTDDSNDLRLIHEHTIDSDNTTASTTGTARSFGVAETSLLGGVFDGGSLDDPEQTSSASQVKHASDAAATEGDADDDPMREILHQRQGSEINAPATYLNLAQPKTPVALDDTPKQTEVDTFFQKLAESVSESSDDGSASVAFDERADSEYTAAGRSGGNTNGAIRGAAGNTADWDHFSQHLDDIGRFPQQFATRLSSGVRTASPMSLSQTAPPRPRSRPTPSAPSSSSSSSSSSTGWKLTKGSARNDITATAPISLSECQRIGLAGEDDDDSLLQSFTDDQDDGDKSDMAILPARGRSGGDSDQYPDLTKDSMRMILGTIDEATVENSDSNDSVFSSEINIGEYQGMLQGMGDPSSLDSAMRGKGSITPMIGNGANYCRAGGAQSNTSSWGDTAAVISATETPLPPSPCPSTSNSFQEGVALAVNSALGVVSATFSGEQQSAVSTARSASHDSAAAAAAISTTITTITATASIRSNSSSNSSGNGRIRHPTAEPKQEVHRGADASTRERFDRLTLPSRSRSADRSRRSNDTDSVSRNTSCDRGLKSNGSSASNAASVVQDASSVEAVSSVPTVSNKAPSTVSEGSSVPDAAIAEVILLMDKFRTNQRQNATAADNFSRLTPQSNFGPLAQEYLTKSRNAAGASEPNSSFTSQKLDQHSMELDQLIDSMHDEDSNDSNANINGGAMNMNMNMSMGRVGSRRSSCSSLDVGVGADSYGMPGTANLTSTKEASRSALRGSAANRSQNMALASRTVPTSQSSMKKSTTMDRVTLSLSGIEDGDFIISSRAGASMDRYSSINMDQTASLDESRTNHSAYDGGEALEIVSQPKPSRRLGRSGSLAETDASLWYGSKANFAGSDLGGIASASNASLDQSRMMSASRSSHGAFSAASSVNSSQTISPTATAGSRGGTNIRNLGSIGSDMMLRRNRSNSSSQSPTSRVALRSVARSIISSASSSESSTSSLEASGSSSSSESSSTSSSSSAESSSSSSKSTSNRLGMSRSGNESGSTRFTASTAKNEGSRNRKHKTQRGSSKSDAAKSADWSPESTSASATARTSMTASATSSSKRHSRSSSSRRDRSAKAGSASAADVAKAMGSSTPKSRRDNTTGGNGKSNRNGDEDQHDNETERSDRRRRKESGLPKSILARQPIRTMSTDSDSGTNQPNDRQSRRSPSPSGRRGLGRIRDLNIIQRMRNAHRSRSRSRSRSLSATRSRSATPTAGLATSASDGSTENIGGGRNGRSPSPRSRRSMKSKISKITSKVFKRKVKKADFDKMANPALKPLLLDGKEYLEHQNQSNQSTQVRNEVDVETHGAGIMESRDDVDAMELPVHGSDSFERMDKYESLDEEDRPEGESEARDDKSNGSSRSNAASDGASKGIMLKKSTSQGSQRSGKSSKDGDGRGGGKRRSVTIVDPASEMASASHVKNMSNDSRDSRGGSATETRPASAKQQQPQTSTSMFALVLNNAPSSSLLPVDESTAQETTVDAKSGSILSQLFGWTPQQMCRCDTPLSFEEEEEEDGDEDAVDAVEDDGIINDTCKSTKATGGNSSNSSSSSTSGSRRSKSSKSTTSNSRRSKTSQNSQGSKRSMNLDGACAYRDDEETADDNACDDFDPFRNKHHQLPNASVRSNSSLDSSSRSRRQEV